jgi:hypothetical protein
MSDPSVPPASQAPAVPGPGGSAPVDSAPANPTSAPSNAPTDFNIGEEYGTARKSLPPAGIVAICVAVVVIIAAVYSLTHRAHPLSSGTVDDVVAVPIPGQDQVMVAVNVSIQNNETNPAWIKTIQVSTDVNGTKVSDDAAPAVDDQRYFQAMPELKAHALEPLTTEKKINPESKVSGTIVVSFPVTADAFAARKSLTVTITPYNELPIVMTK